MIAARILRPQTRPAITRWWHTTTLPEAFGVADADVDELDAARDWRGAQQGHIRDTAWPGD